MKGVIPAIAGVCGLAAAGAVLVLQPPTLDAAVASGLRAPPAELDVRLGARPTGFANLEQQVRGLRRNDMDAWRWLGEAYRARGDDHKAQAAWRRAARLSEGLTRQPDLADDPMLWFCLGWCQWRLGDDQRAGETMQRAEGLFQERTRSRRGSEIWTNIGYCRLVRGEDAAAGEAWSSALAAFRRVYGEAPEGADALYRLARLLSLNGDAAGAIDALERAAAAGCRDGRVEWDPDLGLLRADPRFDAAAARIVTSPEAAGG